MSAPTLSRLSGDLKALHDLTHEVLVDLVATTDDRHPDPLTLHIARQLAEAVTCLHAARINASGGVEVDDGEYQNHLIDAPQ